MTAAEPTSPTVAVENNLVTVRFDRFDLESYRLFMRTKRLPESQVTYDWVSDTYTLTTPARFADRLGTEAPTAPSAMLPPSDYLFDYQRWIVYDLALPAKRFAVWLETGLGKSAILLEWCRQVAAITGGRVLIIQPLGIHEQLCEMARSWYGDALPIETIATREALIGWCRQPGSVVGLTNYEKLIPGQVPEFRHLAGLAADECFPAGTMIDVPGGRKRIEDCIIGDQVLNAAGVDTLSDVHRREVTSAVRITVAGREIISSPNHPYFTQRGWVCAQDILPGDGILATAEAVRMVRHALHGEVPLMGRQGLLLTELFGATPDEQARGAGDPCREVTATAAGTTMRDVRHAVPSDLEAADQAFLLRVLLSEMADEPAGAQGEGPQPRGREAARREEAGVVCGGQSGGGSRAGADPGTQSHEQPRDASQGLPPIESHEAQTFRAWGQRDWFDEASTDLTGCTRTDLGGGISLVTGRTDSRLSIELQARLGRARAANQYRGGWSVAPRTEGERPETRRQDPFARVDRLEVLEQGHPDLERLRDADGKLYFYDLGGTRHPSFSVNGLLVHNSSLLRTGGGVIKWNLIHAARGIEYKLSLTATPAPNEAMEYASQAAFLEKLRTEGDILWTYFTRDAKTDAWRVKAHARAAFYEFMASWSVYLRDPARFGFRDVLADLPPPVVREHELPLTDVQRELMFGLIGRKAGLFNDDRLTLSERSKLSQLAKGFLYQTHDGRRLAARYPSAKPRTVAELAAGHVRAGRQVMVWTIFDEEGEIIAEHLPPEVSREVLSGKQSDAERSELIRRFKAGEVDALISKAVLLGYGLNLQNCRAMVFSGYDDSFERLYQSIRRAYRFGQTETVHVEIPIIPELEGTVFANVKRKEAAFDEDTAIQEAHYRKVLLGA